MSDYNSGNERLDCISIISTHRILGDAWAPQNITYSAALEGATWEEVCRAWHMGWFAHVNLVNLELCLPNSPPWVVLGYRCPRKFSFAWDLEGWRERAQGSLSHHDSMWWQRKRGWQIPVCSCCHQLPILFFQRPALLSSSGPRVHACHQMLTSLGVTVTTDLPWASLWGYPSAGGHAWLCYWLCLSFQIPTWTFTFSSPPISTWDLMFRNKSLIPQCIVVLLACLNPEIPSGKGLLITRWFLSAEALYTRVGDTLYQPLFHHYQLIDLGQDSNPFKPHFPHLWNGASNMS